MSDPANIVMVELAQTIYYSCTYKVPTKVPYVSNLKAHNGETQAEFPAGRCAEILLTHTAVDSNPSPMIHWTTTYSPHPSVQQPTHVPMDESSPISLLLSAKLYK